MTRDWLKEPWVFRNGGIEDASGQPYTLGQKSEARAAACVNAMKGWSAPEGAVAALISWAFDARTALGASAAWSAIRAEGLSVLSRFDPVWESNDLP